MNYNFSYKLIRKYFREKIGKQENAKRNNLDSLVHLIAYISIAL